MRPGIQVTHDRGNASTAIFPGTPPSLPQDFVDSDGDGLFDNEEQRGWVVTTELFDLQDVGRQVTSNPQTADTDNDGLSDSVEKALVTDPKVLRLDEPTTALGPDEVEALHRTVAACRKGGVGVV